MASKFVQKSFAWAHTKDLALKALSLIFCSYSEHWLNCRQFLVL